MASFLIPRWTFAKQPVRSAAELIPFELLGECGHTNNSPYVEVNSWPPFIPDATGYSFPLVTGDDEQFSALE